MLSAENLNGVAEFDQRKLGANIRTMCGSIAEACEAAVYTIPGTLIGDESIVTLSDQVCFTSTVDSSEAGLFFADSLSIAFCPKQSEVDGPETSHSAIDFDFGRFNKLEKITYWGGTFGLVELRPDDDEGLIMHAVDDEADEIARQQIRFNSLREDGTIDARLLAHGIRDYKEQQKFVPLTPEFVLEFMPLMQKALKAVGSGQLSYLDANVKPKNNEPLQPKFAFWIASQFRKLFEPTAKDQNQAVIDLDYPNPNNGYKELRYIIGDCDVRVVLAISADPQLSTLDFLGIEVCTPDTSSPQCPKITERYEISLFDYKGSTYQIYVPNDQPVEHEAMSDAELQALIDGVSLAATEQGLYDLTDAHFKELVALFQRCKDSTPK